MPKYLVEVPEVHKQIVEIEADSHADARRRVEEGEGEYFDQTEYSRTFDPDTWTVTEVK